MDYNFGALWELFKEMMRDLKNVFIGLFWTIALAFIVISMVLSCQAQAGLPPTTIKGQSQTAKPTTFNFQTPNNQATVTASTTSLIETGNGNLLVNPGYEAQTTNAGWTIAGSVASSTNTIDPHDGLKCLSLSTTATSGTVMSQSYTQISAGILDSTTIEISAYFRTTSSNFQLCGLRGTTEVNCTAIPPINAGTNPADWKLVTVNMDGPDQADSTIGWRIKTTTSTTDVIDVDSSYLGKSRTYSYGVNAIPASDINWSAAPSFSKTLSAGTTFTFSNAAPGQTIVVRLTNTASNYTVTWPTVRWSGGGAPTMTVGAKSDVYTFFYDGSNFYGSVVQDMY